MNMQGIGLWRQSQHIASPLDNEGKKIRIETTILVDKKLRVQMKGGREGYASNETTESRVMRELWILPELF